MTTITKLPHDKEAGATVDWTFNFTKYGVDANETLSNPSVTPSSDDLIVDAVQVQGTKVVALISGGVAGTTYTLTVRVQTSGGKVFVEPCLLKVV